MIITFFNQKGGVGKTTCSVLLIDYLLHQGKKVLAIDLDPQGSLSETFLTEDPKHTLLDFFSKKQPLKAVVTPIKENLDLLPSDIDLANMPAIDSAYLDRIKASFISIFKDYDYVVIDTRPSLDWFSRLGIKLANFIFMPNRMSRLSYKALKGALNEIDVFKSSDFKRAVAFENMGKVNKIILKEGYRSKFKKDLEDDFLEIKLKDAIEFEERVAQDINYFESESPNVRDVSLFFDKLMEVAHYG